MSTSQILATADYLALPRSAETWLIKPLLPVGGAMLLYGDPKVGKSYAAVQLACALSSGEGDWLGFPVQALPGPVVYVQLDTPRSLWAERLETLRQTGLPIDECYWADRESLGCYPFDILLDDHFNTLRNALTPIKPGVVIIDTLKESNSADEQSSSEMQVAIARLTAAVSPAALVLISHARKPSENGYDLINDNRGSSYTSGRMDAICRFTRKGLHFVGRSIEEGSLKLERRDDGTWGESADEAAAEAVITSILLDPDLTTNLQKAKALSSRTGKTIESCRSLIRRRVGR